MRALQRPNPAGKKASWIPPHRAPGRRGRGRGRSEHHRRGGAEWWWCWRWLGRCDSRWGQHNWRRHLNRRGHLNWSRHLDRRGHHNGCWHFDRCWHFDGRGDLDGCGDLDWRRHLDRRRLWSGGDAGRGLLGEVARVAHCRHRLPAGMCDERLACFDRHHGANQARRRRHRPNWHPSRLAPLAASAH